MRSAVTHPCVVCGSTERRTVRSLGEHEIRACSCGLLTLFPEPDAVQMEEFEDGSGYEGYFGLEDAIVARHHRTLAGLEQVTSGRRLLDVGCGTGFFLKAARDRGWTGVGVDPSPYSVEQTRALGFEAHVGMLESLSLEPASFDAIALLQVVEHVPDPRPLLQACAALLKPGGALLVATPNPAGLLARVKKERWNYWIPPMHCVWYAPRALSRLLSSSGYRVVRRTTWSARAHGLNDGIEIISGTRLGRALPPRVRSAAGNALGIASDRLGLGTIVEQIAVKERA